MAQLQRYNYSLVGFTSESGEGAQTSHAVYEANAANAKGAETGDVQKICDICGTSFKERDTRLFRGVTYGIPCGDSEDIGSILRKEAADRYRPPRRKPEREGKMLIGY